MNQATPLQKTCPIVARMGVNGLEILAFKHPVTGLQVVKGGIKESEKPQNAAERELLEESGIKSLGIPRALGTTGGILTNERWHFFLMRAHGLPETWDHETSDDHGHTFSFFWQPVEEFLGDEWAKPFIRAIRYAAQKIEKLSPEDLASFMDGVETPLRTRLLEMLDDLGSEKTLCPTDLARAVAGKDEKVWRREMKPIREVAVQLAQEGRIVITRKGKPVDPASFKGLYRIAVPKG